MPINVQVSIFLLLVFGLPLLGVWLSWEPLQPYLEFPPQTRAVDSESFSWPMFLGLALLIALTVGPLVLHLRYRRLAPGRPARAVRGFPWWGWLGVCLTVCSWVLAWNRFSWLATLQPHTFTPLWLGYIVLVNGWTFRRTGRCMMLDRPRRFLALFPASAAFWWCFEYLNRFVQNWYYVGPHAFTPLEYFLHATIPFSTVLPAVLSTMELFASVPSLSAGMDRLRPVHCSRLPWVGIVLLMVASAGLTGIGLWPHVFFPCVWIAPLLLITALQILSGRETIFSGITNGDGTSLWLAALAALFCGVCWEMWNFKSLAHWEYAIPAVHAFKLFEMPLLGYAGYLPFGLECLAVIQWLFPSYYREMLTSLRQNDCRLDSQAAEQGSAAAEAGYFKVWVFSASSSATRRMSSDKT